MYDRLRSVLGIVRLRQLIDQFRHRLSFIPGLYVLGAFVVAQITLFIDRALGDQQVPQLLATTVESARSVFTAIAGGLITSITLLLSMMLITVQLASSQFSPRTLRDWLGDSYLKNTVGFALGTTVFSLVALRSTRSFGEEGGQIVPHISVIVAVIFGVVSLFGVVQSVDHVTQSLQISAVARRIAVDTIAAAEAGEELGAGQLPTHAPSPRHLDRGEERGGDLDDGKLTVPDGAMPVEATAAGWIQQIRAESILERLPEGATGHVVVPLGSFVPKGMPLMWVSPAPSEDHDCRTDLLNAFAIGGSRTMQQDIGFGLVQMADIAIRALSPGINDPSTANDLIVELGDVMLALWAQPVGERLTTHEGRTLVRRQPTHEDHLRRAFDPIRRYGSGDPDVVLTIVRTLRSVASEAERRSLPGPIGPLEQMIADTIDGADTASWARFETDQLRSLARNS